MARAIAVSVFGAWVVTAAVIPSRHRLAPAVAEVRPNVVIVITDDQRADQLTRMPFTNTELVGKGVRFDQAFASHPLCCPSRTSILRGQYAHTTGIYSNEAPSGGWAGFNARNSGWNPLNR